MNLEEIQQALREERSAATGAGGTSAGVDGWLFYDHHYRDPIAYRVLGLGEGLHVTRRWFYYIPAEGEPRKLVHRIESGRLDSLPGRAAQYSSWQELEAGLGRMLGEAKRVAMQYSPRNAIMYVAMVDAGTVELVRSMGVEVVSSADLVSRFEAVLTDTQIATHFEAQRRLDDVLAAGWEHLRGLVRGPGGGSASEFGLVSFFREAIERAGLWTDHGPNVSVGANSADSHYDPTPASSRPIRMGDFVLVDIWAKLAGRPDAVWYDITWTGVVGREPTERERQIFAVVREARDGAVGRVQEAFGRPRNQGVLRGWEADDAARAVIRDAGLAPFFTHRTGHNIGTELHGNGANLDNLETHDDRVILPGTCFSVEPGVYFSGQFGVRSEVNMIARAGRAEVTGRVQTELVRL